MFKFWVAFLLIGFIGIRIHPWAGFIYISRFAFLLCLPLVELFGSGKLFAFISHVLWAIAI